MKNKAFNLRALSVGALLVGTALSLMGCGGGGGTTAGPSSSSGGVEGLAAYGAPVVEGTITVYDVNGVVVSTHQTSEFGAWSLTDADAVKVSHPFPWVIKGEGVGVPTVWSIAFENDIGAVGQSVNINPFTAATLAAVGVNIGDGQLDEADLIVLKNQTQVTITAAGNILSGVLADAFAKMPSTPAGNVFEQMRSTPFWATSTGLDQVLDNVSIRIEANGNISIRVPAIGVSVSIDPALLSAQAEAAKILIKTGVDIAGELLSAPPTLVAFDTQSSWGTASDLWAGFTGAATIVSAKDYGKSPVIKFTSKTFPSAGWWGTSAIYNSQTGEMTLTLPEYASITKGVLYPVGFNGVASKEVFEKAVKSSTGCKINGDPCVITYGAATASDRGTLATADYFKGFGKFFADAADVTKKINDSNEMAGTSTADAIAAANAAKETTSTNTATKSSATANSGVTSSNVLTTTVDTSSSTSTSTTTVDNMYLVTVTSSGGTWSTGFNGIVSVKNTSGKTIDNWSVSLPVGSEAFTGTPTGWNGVFTYSAGNLNMKPATWAHQSLAAGDTWSSGFNGGLASEWLDVVDTASTKFEPGAGLVDSSATQTAAKTSTSDFVVNKVEPIVVPNATTTTTTTEASAVIAGTQNWEKILGTVASPKNTTLNPCNSVRWGDVSSVSGDCLDLMEANAFGGPLHMLNTNQIELVNGKPKFEAFGYFVEWGVYGRKFGAENVAAAQYSKLLFSFLRLMPDGSLMVTDEWATLNKDDTGTLLGLASDPFSSTWENQDRGIMKRLTMLKARFPHLKTAFSIGGWTLSGQFSDVAADPVKRANFVKSSIAFANKFGFDGIDIDWEYPGFGGNQDTVLAGVAYLEVNKITDEDHNNYTLLLKELREAINAGKNVKEGTIEEGVISTARGRTNSGQIEVSIAVGLNPKNIDAVNYADFIDYLDTVNLMSYDFNGAWSGAMSHNAPLYDNNGLEGPKSLNIIEDDKIDQSEYNNHDSVLNILWNIKNQKGRDFKADGELGKGRFHKGDNGDTDQVARSKLMDDPDLKVYLKKLVLGIPFYGRGVISTSVIPSGDLISPFFAGAGQSKITSFGEGTSDAKDIIYARDGKTDLITANGRASTWPKLKISEVNIHWDPIACSSLVQLPGSIYQFDDEDGIFHKAKYVIDKGLGGVMVWEIDGDTNDALLARSFVSGLRGDQVAPRGKTCIHQ